MDWEDMKEGIKTSAKKSLGLHELKQHKLQFDEECSGFLDQRQQAKLQWVDDPSESNVDNLSIVRLEVSKHFRNKKKAYPKYKIEELETISKVKNISELYRGNSDFKTAYHPRTNIVGVRSVICLRTPTVFWVGGGTFLPDIEFIWG